MTLDEEVVRWCGKTPCLLVAHFLVHSYLYYVRDAAVITDETFDWIGRELAARWDGIEHPHKALLDRSLLKSGFYLREEDYPGVVKGAAGRLLEAWKP